MNFNEIYPHATLLTDDFLKNEYEYELYQIKPSERKAIYRNYYLHLCDAIAELHYMRPSPGQIESLLEVPMVSIGDCCMARGLDTKITDPEERRYLFLCATAEQLIFDLNNGRTAMLRGEDERWDVAPDAKSKLDVLGFVRRSEHFRR